MPCAACRWGSLGSLLSFIMACGNNTPPLRDASPLDAATALATTALGSTNAPSSDPTVALTSVPALGVTSTSSAAPVDAGAVPPPLPPIVADNQVEPTEGPELTERAQALLQAIANDEPERAESFWFPKEPFVPLKDVKDPAKYWNQLHRTYVNDIHALHKKRASWSNVAFKGFDGWSRPKWVKPGDEANKIGYYRAFHGKLRYTAGGEPGAIDVHTIITWQGRWYCTHLRKFKK